VLAGRTAELPAGTYSAMLALEDAFEAVRMVFSNDRPTPWTLDAAAVAPSALVNNGYDPVKAAGTRARFTPVTFGGEAGLTVPASPERGVPVHAVSDWIPLRSLPRADPDSDGRPLLVCRVHASKPVHAVHASVLAEPTGWLAEDQGRLLRVVRRKGQDFTVRRLGERLRKGGWLVLAAIQYRAVRRGATLLSVGDSLTQGVVTSIGDPYAWGHFASAALSTRRRPLAFLSGGRAGQGSQDYLRNGHRQLALFKPNIVSITVWSPNDPATAGAADRAWAGALALAQQAEEQGAVPVLATAVPFNLGPGADALRQVNNDRARALAAEGRMLLAELDGAVRDAANTGAVRPEYRSAQGNHLSIAGYRACGTAAVPALARALEALMVTSPGISTSA